MKFTPRKLHDQVVVITGATSGIGLVTARRAAEHGARVVLAARDEEALRSVAAGIDAAGGKAVWTVADTSVAGDVHRIAETAKEAFGGIDTWVNNAAVSIYGDLVDVPLEEQRRLFNVNYWGYVHGSLVAVEHLRERGGVIVNVASVLADRAIPKQGAYVASKHAVKGFTESLRMELEEADLPIAISLIKPASIDTPYPEHAKNYLESAPKNPPPVYAPDAVAEAILSCAENPRRDVTVGGGGAFLVALGNLMPRLTDKVMERTMSRLQNTGRPAGDRERHSLDRPMSDGDERTGYPHHVSETSLYTRARLHPILTATGLLAVVGGAAIALFRR